MVETKYNTPYIKLYRAMPRVQLHIVDSWSFEMGQIKLGIVRDLNLFGLAVENCYFHEKHL